MFQFISVRIARSCVYLRMEVSKPRNRKMKKIALVAVFAAGLVAAVALGMAQKSAVDPAVLHAHLNSVHGEMLGE